MLTLGARCGRFLEMLIPPTTQKDQEDILDRIKWEALLGKELNKEPGSLEKYLDVPEKVIHFKRVKGLSTPAETSPWLGEILYDPEFITQQAELAKVLAKDLIPGIKAHELMHNKDWDNGTYSSDYFNQFKDETPSVGREGKELWKILLDKFKEVQPKPYEKK